MLAFVLDNILHRRNCLVLEPRGAAKTTKANTEFLSWLISMYPDLRVGLISNTAKQSNDFSRAIRWTHENNPRHHEVFGFNVSSAKWTDVEWLHKDSKWHGSKDVTLYSAGAGGAIVSKRFDIIICDDILDEENTSTPEAREKVENWFFKTLLPCLVPDGVVVCIGTRWAEEDLYEVLSTPIRQGGRGWRTLTRKALIETGEGEGEAAYRSYWPQEWPVWMLLDKWADLGTPLFMCAYQNDIRGLLAGNIFHRPDFNYFEELPPDRHYTLKMGVDLASSEKQRADWTARVTTASDDRGEYWVLSKYRDKRESGHAEFIHDGWVAYPTMGLVVCDAQAFQSTLIKEVQRDYPSIPIVGRQVDADKVTRARAVAAKFEAHRVHFHKSLEGSDFELELLGFPKGHDDFVDALDNSMDMGGGGLVFGSVRR